MANRPTTNRSWAEQAPTKDVTEPTAERSDGWDKGEIRPSDQLNWIFRELFRWADYLDEKFNRSREAIDLFDSILAAVDENDEGEFVERQASTDNVVHAEFQHAGTGNSVWEAYRLLADVVDATTEVLTNRVVTQSGTFLDVRRSAAQGTQASGDVLARTFDAQQSVETDVIQPNSSPPEIDVRDSFGNSGDGYHNALDTPKAWAIFELTDRADDSDPGSYSLTTIVSHRVTSITHTGNVGQFEVEIDTSPPANNEKIVIAQHLKSDNLNLVKTAEADITPGADDVFLINALKETSDSNNHVSFITGGETGDLYGFVVYHK